MTNKISLLSTSKLFDKGGISSVKQGILYSIKIETTLNIKVVITISTQHTQQGVSEADSTLLLLSHYLFALSMSQGPNNCLCPCESVNKRSRISNKSVLSRQITKFMRVVIKDPGEINLAGLVTLNGELLTSLLVVLLVMNTILQFHTAFPSRENVNSISSLPFDSNKNVYTYIL